MPKKANITISHKGKASDTDINNGSFKVNLGQEGQLNWLSEKTSFGSGDQTDLPRLIQEHDELQGKGEHAIVGFDVKHR